MGLNENLAREILELHTLGVDGGYTQKDVTTFAEVITGWSIGGNTGRFSRGEPGKFVFRPEVHEPGAKTVLGKTYSQDDESAGRSPCCAMSLPSPATAKFIATKLARHFISDEPPPEAVERIAKAFTRRRGDLPTLYRALVDTPDAWTQPLAKYKTPNDYIVSTFRGARAARHQRARGRRVVRAAGPAHVQPGLAGRLAGSQRGLGWRVGVDEAHRMGGRGGPARRRASERGGPRAGSARR